MFKIKDLVFVSINFKTASNSLIDLVIDSLEPDWNEFGGEDPITFLGMEAFA